MTKGTKKSAQGEVETVQLARKDLPDVRWTGRLLAQVDSDGLTRAREGERKSGARWTRLELWELENGTWIAASIGCSDRPGEIDIGDVERVPAEMLDTSGAETEVGETVGGITPRWTKVTGKPSGKMMQCNPEWRIQRVMGFFRWTWLAKKLAEQMGWDVVEVIAE